MRRMYTFKQIPVLHARFVIASDYVCGVGDLAGSAISNAGGSAELQPQDLGCVCKRVKFIGNRFPSFERRLELDALFFATRLAWQKRIEGLSKIGSLSLYIVHERWQLASVHERFVSIDPQCRSFR